MKVVIVGYLNTMPFIQGLKHYGLEIIKAHPAKCAEILHEGQVDAGLVPLGALEEDQTYYLLKDFGISCNGEVRTVCLFGETPIEEWEEVVLDYQSRTSVLLAQILLKEYWSLKPTIIKGYPGYEKEIKGSKGGLIIGDRAFEYEEKLPYKYDLGAIWKEMTGLPFVFALWVATKPLSIKQRDLLENALEYGIKNFEMTDSMVNLPLDAKAYFKKNIEYEIDFAKQKAVQLFLHKTGKSNLKLIDL